MGVEKINRNFILGTVHLIYEGSLNLEVEVGRACSQKRSRSAFSIFTGKPTRKRPSGCYL